ncbi:Sel1 repeat protein [Legionella israelensis]|uniref:Sel1 repeat protein n=2 Tax=Legionella israelensis TaxID=454 RepID=A0A0W0W1C5_9GAMM|nr:Sel1 repeat protein [Legionella israelensis]SCY26396.1 hypothetical protein SAMN02746069_01823 [Legionella israelensis DSM 19235]STX59749.1 Sel1 repeat protein [Legionella israelensis]
MYLIRLFLSITILFAINVAFCANSNDLSPTSSIKKFIPNELMLENCLDSEIIRKISNIDFLFRHFADFASLDKLKIFKQKLSVIKLTKSQFDLLISKSKKSDLCGANANLALGIYEAALNIMEKNENKKKLNLYSKYMEHAFSIYRNYANQGSIGPIKLLCVLDEGDGFWVVNEVDALSKDICLKALYTKEIKLSPLEKTKMFTSVYNSYLFDGLDKNLVKRAEVCYEFAKEANIMNYLNGMYKQQNKDMCNAEFIGYGEQLFSNKDYQEAFRYLSIFDQSLNGWGIPQFELGYMYQTGKGVSQNYALALDWYKKASKYGNNAYAQYNLGVMYTKGQGVLQNYTLAHAFYNLASANGIEDAATVRDMLAKKMTNEQIERAQTLAKEWTKKGRYTIH